MNVTEWAWFGYAVAIGVPLLVLLRCVWPHKRTGPSVDDITTRIAREEPHQHQQRRDEPHRDRRPQSGDRHSQWPR